MVKDVSVNSSRNDSSHRLVELAQRSIEDLHHQTRVALQTAPVGFACRESAKLPAMHPGSRQAPHRLGHLPDHLPGLPVGLVRCHEDVARHADEC